MGYTNFDKIGFIIGISSCIYQGRGCLKLVAFFRNQVMAQLRSFDLMDVDVQVWLIPNDTVKELNHKTAWDESIVSA